MATLSSLVRKTARAYRRVGRGQSSTRGKTSGRGGKGQTARAGHKIRPELRDIIKKLPKRRGYGKNRARTVNPTRADAFAVSLEALEATFENGAEVTLKALAERNVIPTRAGRPVAAKILGTGTLTKKLSIKGCAVSGSAKAAIEKAGGTIAQ
jgi:large subunit ribosomal protein L15